MSLNIDLIKIVKNLKNRKFKFYLKRPSKNRFSKIFKTHVRFDENINCFHFDILFIVNCHVIIKLKYIFSVLYLLYCTGLLKIYFHFQFTVYCVDDCTQYLIVFIVLSLELYYTVLFKIYFHFQFTVYCVHYCTQYLIVFSVL